jgi:hypothetical protein
MAVAIVVACALVALAVVTIRDLAVSQGWATGQPWLAEALTGIDRLEPTPGVMAAGTAVGLVGLLLLLAGLLPPKRRYVTAAEAEHLWSSPSALAEVARAAADRSQGVLSARAVRASRGRVLVEVATREDRSSSSSAVGTAKENAAAAGAGLGAHRVDVRAAKEDDA